MIDEDLKQMLIDIAEYGAGHCGFETVQEGEWEVDHKWEHKETIIKYLDKFYCVQQSRSGSYFTDYYYNDPDVYEVEPKEITTIVYRKV
jgi:hypothetical protein